jgi:hypothetical protein
VTAPRSRAARLALVLVAALTWACGGSDRDSAAGAGGAPSAPGTRGAGGAEGRRDAGPGTGGVGQKDSTGGASGGSSEAGADAWLSACQACAEQTPACQDEECLRCIYEEPRLGNEHCDPTQQAFEIESFAILNAGCREACPSP